MNSYVLWSLSMAHRLHSCYPWHKGGAYRSLMAPGDEELEAAVRGERQRQCVWMTRRWLKNSVVEKAYTRQTKL